MVPECLVMQRAAIFQRDAQHRAFRRFGGLANGFGHFACLAMSKPNPAALIADNDKGGEAKAPSTFHDLRNTIDMHELIDEIAIFVVAVAGITCH
jgi:hypothetical protein